MFEALRGLSLEQTIKGMNAHIKHNRFVPPNAASILEAVQGVAEDRAILAFDEVLDAHKLVNSGHSVRFHDPVIHFALKQCRGWTGFCHMDEAESRKIFIQSYAAGFRNGIGWDQVEDHMKGEREAKGSVLYPWTPDQIVEIESRRNMAVAPVERQIGK